MLSFPRRRRGKDNRQLYLVPDITSFIWVCQRDNHIKKWERLVGSLPFLFEITLSFKPHKVVVRVDEIHVVNIYHAVDAV